jgi:PAS domain S-box-containing protein
MNTQSNQMFQNPLMGYAHHRVILDDDGRPADYEFVEVNTAFERFTGLSKDYIVGQTVRHAIPGIANDPFDWISYYGKIALERGKAEFEQYSPALRRWYQVYVYATEDLHFATMFLDVTAAKQAEGILRDSQAQQEAYLKNAPFGVMIIDRSGRYLEVNGEACRHTGYTPDELKMMTIYDITHPDSMNDSKTHFMQLNSIGRAYGEISYLTKAGERRWWNVVATRLPDGRFLGFHEDITERKHFEIKLQESETNFMDIFQSVSEGICYSDASGEIISVNEALVRMTGIPAGDLLGKNILELGRTFLDQKNQAAALDFTADVINGKNTSPVEIEINNRIIEITATKSKANNRLIGVLRDITGHRLAENALEKHLIALSQPLDKPDGIMFEDLFNLNNIQRLQDEFAQAARVASIITSPDGTPITVPSNFCRLCNDIIRNTEKGRANCFKSDAILGQPDITGPKVQPCLSGGLWDAGAAISVGGRHIANWLIGQVRDEAQNEESIRAYARSIGADEYEAVAAFHEVPAMSRTQFEKVAKALHTLAGQLSDFAYQNVQQSRFIAGRKQAEEALRASNQFITSLLRAIPVGIFYKDKDGRYMGCNDVFADITGYTAEDIKGKKIYEIWPGELSQSYHQIEMELIETRQNRIYESEVRDKSGQMIPVIFAKDIFLDAHGEVAGIVGAFLDISDRKQSEIALLQSESRNRAMLEALPDSMLVFDRDGFITDAKYGHPGDLIAPPEQFLHRHFSEVLPPELVQITRKRLEEVFISRQTQIYESQVDIRGKARYFEARMVLAGDNMALTIIRDISARKEAELALRDSEKKYHGLYTLLRLMTDNMPDMLWAKNLQKEFVFVNQAICRNLLNAADTAEPLGKTDMFFASRERNAHPENPAWHTFGEICRDSDAVTLEEMRPMQFDEFGNVKGEFLFLDVHKAPLYDEEGRLIGVVGSARDVTASKEAETQLRRLSQAIEQSPVSVVMTDLEGRIEYVNPRFSEMTGYSFTETRGQKTRLLNPGVLPDDQYQQIKESFRRGLTWQGELMERHKSGNPFWESATLAPVYDNQGQLKNYLIVAEDITERKAIEENLKHQTRFRKLLMEIASGFINLPLDMVDDQVNDALGKMARFVTADRAYTFDYNWESRVCDNIYEWCEEGISPEIDNLQGVPLDMMPDWVEAHQKGDPMYVPDVFKLPRGAAREILEPQGIRSVLAVPMMNGRNCIGFVGFDSVRQHHNYSLIEMELLQLFAQMLANVKMRKEITGQLFVAKERAEESDRLKTAFLQNLSHEIRTPLNGIIGFSGLLKDPDVSDDEKLTFTDIVIERGWQLTAIINDILTIAALETKQEQLYEEVFNLNVLLQNQITVFAPQANQKGLQLHLAGKLPEKHANIKADKAKLGQILNNLFANAIKFTKDGRVDLACCIKENLLEFCVKDTGIGIDWSKHALIFERFAQADDSIRIDFGGTGLGLSICRGFTELMGGRIWVESEPGQGSAFFFTIPYNPVAVAANDGQTNASFQANGKMVTILVAEDDDLNFLFLESMLKRLDVKVLRAMDGRMAIELSKDESVAMVLMDIKMPGINGYEAAQQIRAFRPQLPIIAQTAYAVQSEIAMFAEAFDDYLIKPYTREKIGQLLQKYIDLRN